ncbi:hypothetical protein [Hymenobacter sp.]|jgi:uncharacterized membrane protein|uniref:hypothetical protein n=1 Tax=Hymenobacter sp. TaxID=1898978 RepID=UPI002EDB4236
MKHLFNILPKLTIVAAIALSASSCNRAEYAMLPKTTPYHATYGTTKSVPAPTVVNEKATTNEVPAAEAIEKNAVATTPAVKAPAASTKPTPIAAAPSVAKAPKAAAKPAPRKANLVQRLAVAKVLKQVDKASSKVQIKKHTETAGTKRLEGKLRQGLILILVGLLVGLLGAIGGVIGSIFAVVGSILFIIGVVLIILYLLDEL